MQTKFKKTLLAALPVAGLLFTAPAVFAHDDNDRHDWDRQGNRHEQYHDRLDNAHERFESRPHAEREHQQSDRYLSRRHRDFHNDRQGWRDRDRDGWGWGDRNRGWDWHRRNNDRDWSWGRSGYNRRYNDDYSRRSWQGWYNR